MTPFMDFGGHPTRVVEDRYADGRKCVVAEHPDLPGCVAYADNPADALAALKDARVLYLQSVRRHEGAPTPRSVATILQETTSISGANLQLQPA